MRKWTRRNWQSGIGIVQAIKTDSHERAIWMQEARCLSLKNGVPAGPRGLRIRTWANVQQQDLSDGDYPREYPHKHATEPGITLILYLDCDADSPALEILTDDFELEDTIRPEIGKVVLCRNGVYHQVRKNRSENDRIALIAEAYW